MRPLGKVKPPLATNQLTFISEKTYLYQEQNVNKRNEWLISPDVRDIGVVLSTSLPATVIALSVILCYGNVITHFIFEKRFMVNANAYIRSKYTALKQWVKNIARDRHYIFQQDGALTLNDNKTQAWLKKNLK